MILLLFLILLIFLLARKDTSDSGSPSNLNHSDTVSTPLYRAGKYTSTLALGDSMLNLEIVLDTTHIKSLRLINLDESVTTMYPLIEPALEAIAKQLKNDVSINDVRLTENSKYTQALLLEIIEHTLNKATYSEAAN